MRTGLRKLSTTSLHIDSTPQTGACPPTRTDYGSRRTTDFRGPRARGRFTGGRSQAANVSIAYLLTFNGVQALFTGDVEPKVARRIAAELQPVLDDPVDIFLATHHGSAAGSVQELLDIAPAPAPPARRAPGARSVRSLAPCIPRATPVRRFPRCPSSRARKQRRPRRDDGRLGSRSRRAPSPGLCGRSGRSPPQARPT